MVVLADIYVDFWLDLLQLATYVHMCVCMYVRMYQLYLCIYVYSNFVVCLICARMYVLQATGSQQVAI